MIDDWKDIHYVDTDIPDSRRWEVYDKITPDEYDSVSFLPLVLLLIKIFHLCM
ncbi:MAG: hypothetical protein R2759_12815 [Bacteroidales bacterium]